MSRINQVKAGSILSYLQMGINILIQLAYTPVMIQLLGESDYGLYNTVSSAISMLGVLDLGLNAGYIRYFSMYKKGEDQTSIQKLNGLMLLIFLFIGLIGLVCGCFLAFNLDIVFDNGLTETEYSTARVLMLLLTVNLAVSFPMSVFQNIISAHERFVFLKVVSMIRTVCSPLITLPLLLMGYRSIALVSVTVIFSAFADICYLYYVLICMGERFIFADFEKGILKSIFGYTFFITLNTIINQINWNIDKMLLARFKGTAQVAVYSVAFTLFHCYMSFSTAISGVFSPRVHRIVNDTNGDPEKQKGELTLLFIKVGRVQFIILSYIASGFAIFGHYFIVYIWAGESYGKSYIVALLLILTAFVSLIQNIGIEIQRAENKHQFRSVVYMAMAFLNLWLSMYLCQFYGAVGCAIGTSISYVVANGFVMNVYYHLKCNIDIIAFWRSIAGLTRGLGVPLIVGIYLYYNTCNSLLMFVLRIAIYSVVYVISMWLLGMNDYEKNLFREPMKKVVRKFKKVQC